MILVGSQEYFAALLSFYCFLEKETFCIICFLLEQNVSRIDCGYGVCFSRCLPCSCQGIVKFFLQWIWKADGKHLFFCASLISSLITQCWFLRFLGGCKGIWDACYGDSGWLLATSRIYKYQIHKLATKCLLLSSCI